MRCPKCYGKVDKITKVCQNKKCGFNLNELNEATNFKAKEKMRSGDGDLVIYTTKLPKDISKKNLLLLSGFLGLFGAHYFYIGKMLRGLINLVVSMVGTVFAIFYALNLTGDKVFKYFDYFSGILFALILVLTISDFINICFNRFKVPVYIEEK